MACRRGVGRQVLADSEKIRAGSGRLSVARRCAKYPGNSTSVNQALADLRTDVAAVSAMADGPQHSTIARISQQIACSVASTQERGTYCFIFGGFAAWPNLLPLSLLQIAQAVAPTAAVFVTGDWRRERISGTEFTFTILALMVLVTAGLDESAFQIGNPYSFAVASWLQGIG
jgi:hypothetical protein